MCVKTTEKKVQTRGNVLFTCVEYTITDCTTSSIAVTAAAAVAQRMDATTSRKKLFCFQWMMIFVTTNHMLNAREKMTMVR